jgi:hypothetical protein
MLGSQHKAIRRSVSENRKSSGRGIFTITARGLPFDQGQGASDTVFVELPHAISGQILTALVPRSPLEAMEKGPHILWCHFRVKRYFHFFGFYCQFFRDSAYRSQSQDATVPLMPAVVSRFRTMEAHKKPTIP